MTAAFRQIGLKAYGYDILQGGGEHDCLSEAGLATYVAKMLHMRPNSLQFLGPPCCSWGFLSRSNSKRTRDSPAGDLANAWVAAHNLIAEFVALVIMALTSLAVFFVIENPRGSLIYHYPAVKLALEQCIARKVAVSLWGFGCSNSKPLTLFGTAPWLERLQDKSRELFRRRSAAGGRPLPLVQVGSNGQITGIGKALSASAAYPPAFCMAVADYHKTFLLACAQVATPPRQLLLVRGTKRARESEDSEAASDALGRAADTD